MFILFIYCYIATLGSWESSHWASIMYMVIIYSFQIPVFFFTIIATFSVSNSVCAWSHFVSVDCRQLVQRLKGELSTTSSGAISVVMSLCNKICIHVSVEFHTFMRGDKDRQKKTCVSILWKLKHTQHQMLFTFSTFRSKLRQWLINYILWFGACRSF